MRGGVSFAVLHKWVAYLLSGLGLFALSLGYELSGPIVAAMFAAFVGSYFVEGPVLHRPAYARLWTGGVVAFLVIQVVRAVLVEPGLRMALEFAAVLQLSRLYNRRTAQDYQQIAVLSFLHLIAATVLSTKLTYALVFVGFVIATPWMLALSHLRREIEANYPAFADDGGKSRAALARVLASKRVVGGRFLLGTALLSVPLFTMTLAIFLIVPRVGQGFLTLGGGPGEKVAGFGDQVELGGFGVIRDDPAVVLRVTPLPRLDPKARRLTLRMRGTSFDHYDGRLWSRTNDLSRALEASANHKFVLRRPPRPTDQVLHVVLDHLEQPVVFIPTGTVALSADPKVVRAHRIPRRLRHSTGYDIRYVDLDQEGFIYDAYVSHTPDEQPIEPLLPEELDLYLQVPEGHEQVEKLAQEVTAAATTPLAKIQAVLVYLQSSRFTYSLLQPQVNDGEYPLNAFLFRERRGHCEYFSTAMAVMLRALGIPSRNVTGLFGGQYNPYGEYYALRQGDAHSWVEAFVDELGWVTFDPTPPLSVELARHDGLWSDLHAFVDALRVRWMTSVVGYDLRAQLGLLRDAGRLFAGSGRSGGADRDSGANDGQVKASVRRWGLALVLLFAGATGLFLWRRRRRRPAPGAGPLSVDAIEAVRLYVALERALVKKGYLREPGVTPLEHARALRRRGFEAADAVDEVTHGYLQARYGDLPLPRERLAQLKQAVALVEQASSAGAKAS